jgi:glycosyltransferase involved in cell wall biosynthesis
VTQPLRILYVAYPLLTVSCESAGGAEQVLWTLEREIASRGVLTTVAASVGSRVSGELFSTGEPCTRPDDYERRRGEHEDLVVELVRLRARQGRAFDLVHDMSGSFWPRAAEIGTPVLATLHLPRSFYPPKSFCNVPPHVTFNCVSQTQARSFADLGGLAGVAANGIALETLLADSGNHNGAGSERREGLLWLGRICEEKAPHLALEIAARAGRPITIAGQVYPFSYHQQYFEREVLPRLHEMPTSTYLAAPAAEVKRHLLRRAQAVLITSLADETSSLVAMEAAASGTPVVTFRRGALAEIVRDKVTGMLVEGADEAVKALEQVSRINAAACVRHARKTFSAVQMAGRYTRFYARIARQKISARNPAARDLQNEGCFS